MKPNIGAGDSGTCQLFGEGRVDKDYCLIDAYGDLDELNSHIGHLGAYHIVGMNFGPTVKSIQDDLFVIGSHFSTSGKQPEIEIERVRWLEEGLQFLESDLPELKTFILPSGGPEASFCHICRAVCRRVERKLVGLLKERNQYSNESGAQSSCNCLSYVNRLSDYLFAMARYLNKLTGHREHCWSGDW